MTPSFLTTRCLSAVLRPYAARSLASNYNPPVMNEGLRSLPAVRLISESGQDCGVMPTREALRRAQELNKDLMQVHAHTGDPDAPPPVVRILDYNTHESSRRKYQYDRRKSIKEAQKVQKRESILKQLRLSPSTDTNDMDIKLKKAKEFLTMGYRVKIFMQFRRGQGRLESNAKKSLVGAAHKLSEVGIVQGVPAGGTVDDLFVSKGEESSAQPAVRRPMHIVIQPFARKLREKLLNDKMQ